MERGQNPNIIKGRMPVAVVHVLRFGSLKGGSTKDIAAKDEKAVTTREMGAAILEELKALA